jgi:hypothetical protein
MSIVSKLLTAGCLAAGACALTLAATPPDAFAKPAGKADKGPKGREKKGGPKGKAHDLKKTYDDLAQVSALTRPAGKKGERRGDPDTRRYLDAAKRLYRDAVRAADTAGPEARERAVAAHDAARGLKHWVTASLPPVPDLPRPPGGPLGEERWEPARRELQRAADRLGEVADAGGPAGREFREAADRAYRAARSAYEARDFERAAELARAAEAWTHVGEHLTRATGDGPPSPPDGRADRVPPPPPPPERGDRVPPPPPPERRPPRD